MPDTNKNKSSDHPKVMLVEDENNTRELIELVLKQSFCRVHSFSHGREALEYFTLDRQWDLIILDLFLPGINGLDILKAIRKTDTKTPICVFTGWPEDTFAEQALKAGANLVSDKSDIPNKLPAILAALNKTPH